MRSVVLVHVPVVVAREGSGIAMSIQSTEYIDESANLVGKE
jgi:hypothetical protein